MSGPSGGSVGERGVSAVLVALLLVPMIGFVALALDISRLNDSRQQLWNSVDAAALAGADLLPDADAARAAAIDFAQRNTPGLVPVFEFRCIVGVDAFGGPDETQIPLTCDPGPGPYTVAEHPGMACDDVVCSFPCNPDPPESDACNTMLVAASQIVDYLFAPVIGFDKGDTGVVSMAACSGACGTLSPVPADIVLVVDRTGSMRPEDRDALKIASLVFLEELSPKLHSVALGTIGRAQNSPPPNCPSQANSNRDEGPWVPVGLRSDYDLTDNDPPDDPPDLNSVSQLVIGIECLGQSGTGTNLGDPMAAAAAHLLANGRAGSHKAIVFMTDGAANEPEIASPCNHAANQAQIAKDAGITVVTIAYRLEGVSCEGLLATDLLADMASDPPDGPLTDNDGGDGPGGLPGDCAASASENLDGDYFFCSPDGSSLDDVFKTASAALVNAFGGQAKFIKLPG